VADIESDDGALLELALFAGGGGGILGGRLLGWRTVCAVEINPFAASILCARQNDGTLEPFPIWGDIRSFRSRNRDCRQVFAFLRSVRHRLVISGGFPCQDISVAGGGRDSTENARACGRNRRESFAKYDPDTCGWRTHQRSLEGGFIEFSETWPRWGSMRDGECYPLKMPSGLKELRQSITGVNASGSTVKLPTLTVQDSANNGPPSQLERNTPPLNAVVGGPLNPEWGEWLMGWPIGWTDLRPLETDKFQQWSSSHGKS
jgi:DNA (cytosine-5)-methyltransferase 1